MLRAPSSWTKFASSAASRVFPTPGSPARSATRRSPVAASFHSSRRPSVCCSRPTKIRLTPAKSEGRGEGRHGQRVPRHLEGWQRCQQALQFECAERSELMTAS